MNLQRSNFLFLIFCLTLSTVFIFDHIGVRSFWLDEAAVGNIIHSPATSLLSKSIVEGHPASYILALKFWSLFFGDGEIALRSFSAICTLLTIILLYKFSTEFFPQTAVKYWTPFLAATNYFLIWHSSQAKGYPFIALLSLLSYYFLLKIILRRSEILLFIGYFAATMIGTYTHPWFFLIFASQWLVLLLGKPLFHQFRTILFCQLFILIISAPSWLGFLRVMGNGASDWMPQVNLSILRESLGFATQNLIWGYLLAATASGYFMIKLKNRLQINTFFLWSLTFYLFFPPLTATFISQFSPAYAAGRYEIMILPAFFLLLGVLLSHINSKNLSFAIGGLIIFSAGSAVNSDRNQAISLASYDDRKAAVRLWEKVQDGDTIITTDLSYAPFDYYFYHLNQNQHKTFTLISFPQEISEHPGWKSLPKMLARSENYQNEAKNLAEKLKAGNHKTIWVIFNSSNPLNKFIYDELMDNFKFISSDPLPPVHQPLWFDSILAFQ